MRGVLAEWRPVVDEEIERLLPRLVDDAYLGDFFGEASHEYDATAVQEALSDPIWDLLDRGGKRWRAVVFLLLVEGFGEDPHDYLPYACIPEILHNGTIIVDDVEDGATMRRGERALHLEYGTDIALNAGNAMYFLPLKVITRNPGDLDPGTRLAAYEMLMHELNRTHLGQGMDIHWHNEQEIRIDESQYLEMCACKTGCLGRIVARLAAIVTGQPEHVESHVADYAQQMSIAFQIGDDILDIEHTIDLADDLDAADGKTGEFGKEFGNDIREGKKTLMVIHAAREAAPDDVARLEEILWADENTREEILTAIDILQSTGSIEYAREQALALAADAREELAAVDLESEAADNLAAFTRFVVERDV
jgi:geranylgeranyl diphosphate synthase type I